MNTFSKLYDTELHNQEIKSNKRTLMGFCWFFLTLLLVWVLTMINFFLISKFLISLSLGFTVLLLISPVIIYKKADLSSPWIKYLFLALISIICSIITALLTYHAVLIFVMPLLFAIQYRKRQALWFSFIFNTITMFISSYVGFYYGLCDLNLLLESTHTRNWYLQTMSGSFLQIPFNENPVFIIAVFEVLPRTLILLIFTIMLQYTIISSHNDALRIAELTYRKDMDARTKLYNKNKYEDMAVNYYPSVGYIAVAFWDLNNLKMINDNFGHAVGDSLIQTMSEKLLAVSNERCRTYRVGGDEFLLILDDPAPGEINRIIQQVKTELSSGTGTTGLRILAAVGSAEGCGADIRSPVKKQMPPCIQTRQRARRADHDLYSYSMFSFGISFVFHFLSAISRCLLLSAKKACRPLPDTG